MSGVDNNNIVTGMNKAIAEMGLKSHISETDMKKIIGKQKDSIPPDFARHLIDISSDKRLVVAKVIVAKLMEHAETHGDKVTQAVFKQIVTDASKLVKEGRATELLVKYSSHSTGTPVSAVKVSQSNKPPSDASSASESSEETPTKESAVVGQNAPTSNKAPARKLSETKPTVEQHIEGRTPLGLKAELKEAGGIGSVLDTSTKVANADKVLAFINSLSKREFASISTDTTLWTAIYEYPEIFAKNLSAEQLGILAKDLSNHFDLNKLIGKLPPDQPELPDKLRAIAFYTSPTIQLTLGNIMSNIQDKDIMHRLIDFSNNRQAIFKRTDGISAMTNSVVSSNEGLKNEDNKDVIEARIKGLQDALATLEREDVTKEEVDIAKNIWNKLNEETLNDLLPVKTEALVEINERLMNEDNREAMETRIAGLREAAATIRKPGVSGEDAAAAKKIWDTLKEETDFDFKYSQLKDWAKPKDVTVTEEELGVLVGRRDWKRKEFTGSEIADFTKNVLSARIKDGEKYRMQIEGMDDASLIKLTKQIGNDAKLLDKLWSYERSGVDDTGEKRKVSRLEVIFASLDDEQIKLSARMPSFLELLHNNEIKTPAAAAKVFTADNLKLIMSSLPLQERDMNNNVRQNLIFETLKGLDNLITKMPEAESKKEFKECIDRVKAMKDNMPSKNNMLATDYMSKLPDNSKLSDQIELINVRLKTKIDILERQMKWAPD